MSVAKGPMREGVFRPAFVSAARDPGTLVSLDVPPGPGVVQVIDLLLRPHWVELGHPDR